MATPYATPAELEAFLPAGSAVDEAERLLARATELIDEVVRLPFTVSTVTGLPTDSTLAGALRDAVCAQVEQWLEVGEENDVDGLAGTQVGIGAYSGLRAPKVAPRAVRFLGNAGLLSGAWVDGRFPLVDA